jgi:hypothetical protein
MANGWADVVCDQYRLFVGIIMTKFRNLRDNFVIIADPFIEIPQICTGQ